MFRALYIEYVLGAVGKGYRKVEQVREAQAVVRIIEKLKLRSLVGAGDAMLMLGNMINGESTSEREYEQQPGRRSSGEKKKGGRRVKTEQETQYKSQCLLFNRVLSSGRLSTMAPSLRVRSDSDSSR